MSEISICEQKMSYWFYNDKYDMCMYEFDTYF